MKYADPNVGSLIAKEQYGCRKNHRALEVLLNRRLVSDTLQIQRKLVIICSNDVKSCFKRIAHAIFAICLHRLGAHENLVKSSFDTLQNLEYHIRSAFGDSAIFYIGNNNYPVQGLVQSYGTSPTGWVSASSHLIKMMGEEGYVFKDWTALLSIAFSLVCFAFVDDTDLVNTLADGESNIIASEKKTTVTA